MVIKMSDKIYIQAYDDMDAALGRFYKAIDDTNNELTNQVKAMQDAMDDDYGDELCAKVGEFINRMHVFCDDVMEVERVLNDRMTELFN